jgi:hypothetical protein
VKPDIRRVSQALLELASRYEQNGRVHQAAELYFDLLRLYPATREALVAVEKVVGMAQRFEAGGKPRLALSLYRKLAASVSPTEKYSGASPEDAGMGEGALPPGSHGTAGAFGRAREIPFVDLTRPADVKQNFERLGWVQRSDAVIHRAVSELRKLKR